MARLSAMPSCCSHSIRFVLLLFLLELSTTHLLLVESTSSSHWQNENGNLNRDSNGNNGNRNVNENRNGNGKRQTAAEANCTLVIGGSLSFSPEPASNPQYYQSRHIRDGLLLFQNWSDSQGPIWVDGDLCNFTFKVYDDWGNHTLAKQIYQEFIDNNTADFFITPPSTDMGIAARTITEPNGRLLVGTLVASSFFYIDQPHTFGLCTVETNSFQSGLQLYALQGAKTVAYVVELKSSFFRAQCNAVEENALSSGMSLLDGGGFTVFSSNDVLVDGYWENMTTTAHSLAALDPDVIIVCGHMALPKNLLRALEIVDYMPGAVYYGSLDIPVFEAVPTEHARFVAGAAQWTPLAKKPGDPNIFGTPAQFNETFFNTFGYEAGRSSAVGTTAAILIRLAVERAGTRNQEEVIRALSLINVELFWGRIAFDAHGGLTLRDPDSIQYGFNRELMMVAPSRYATSQVIYPMPTWSERYYDPQYFAHDSEIVIAVLSGVCMLISIGLMIFTVIYWRHIVITAASPLFLLFFLVGSVILDASVFMRMLHTNGVMCILTLWFWAIGFGLMFGALLAKTWRITKIINDTKGKNGSLFTKILLWLRIKSEKKHKKKRKQNKFNKVEVITWRKLLLILSIIVGVEVLILSLYTIIAPFFDLTEKVEESELYQSENYTQCELTPVAIVFMVLLAIYNVGLMVWGVILSWMLRNVQWALFNESKAIAFAMYNMFFFSVLIGALEFSGAVSRETMFILRSLGIFAATSISVWVIFAPKIYFILRRVNSLDGSTSKDNKMSLPEVEEIKVERDRGVETELEEKPEDDSQVRRLKALLRQVRMRMQEGSIALKWEELERSVEMEMGMEDVSSSSSSASSEDMENEEGVP